MAAVTVDLTSDDPVDEAIGGTQTVTELEEQLTLVEEELLDVSTPLGRIRNLHDVRVNIPMASIPPLTPA